MNNKDFTKEQSKDLPKKDEAQSTPPDVSGEPESAQVKNAHATGDGSFGRNDESLPEPNDDKNKQDTTTY